MSLVDMYSHLNLSRDYTCQGWSHTGPLPPSMRPLCDMHLHKRSSASAGTFSILLRRSDYAKAGLIMASSLHDAVVNSAAFHCT